MRKTARRATVLIDRPLGIAGKYVSAEYTPPTSGNCELETCTCSTTCTAPPPPGDACGYPLDGVWFEIDYSSASTATSPAWTFSNTPGWTGADWAPNGYSWPEVWDLYNKYPELKKEMKDAAKELGITPRALNYRIQKLKIKHPRWRKNK